MKIEITKQHQEMRFLMAAVAIGIIWVIALTFLRVWAPPIVEPSRGSGGGGGKPLVVSLLFLCFTFLKIMLLCFYIKLKLIS
jgi:hypothetical protein